MPTVSETTQILDFISENPQDQRSFSALKKLGLEPIAIEAWKGVKNNPSDPKAIAVKNKIFDTISANLPAKQEINDTVGFVDRFAVKNLIDRDPELQKKYFEKKGFNARITDGQVEIKKPEDVQFTAVDPKGIDRFDIFDIFGDALEAVATGFATGSKVVGAIGAPVTGGGSLAAGVGLGAAATGGFEAGKQALAKGLGLREDYDVQRIAESAAIGGAAPLVIKGAGKLLGKMGESIGWLSSKFGNAPKSPAQIQAIEDAAQVIGAKATPGQLSESKFIQKLESKMAQQTGKLGGTGFRSQIESNIKAAQETAESIIKDASSKTNFEIGDAVKKDLVETVKRRIDVPIAIYDKWENVLTSKYADELARLKSSASEQASLSLGAVREPSIQSLNKLNIYSPNVEQLKKTISGLFSDKKMEQEGLSVLNKYKGLVDKINTFEDLKDFRSAIGTQLSDPNLNKSALSVLNSLYSSTTNLRNEAIEKAAKSAIDPADKKLFSTALDEIKDADAIYSSVSNDLKNVLYGAKRVKTGSPNMELDKFTAIPEVSIIDKVLSTNDPKKIENVKNAFPEIFEKLRSGKIEDISARAAKNGVVNPKMLAKIIDKMEPETANMIFGIEGVKKAKALKVFLDSVPDKLGPSGTPEGLEFAQLFNPFAQGWSLAYDQFRKLVSETPIGKDIFSRAGKGLQGSIATGLGEFGARNVFQTPSEREYYKNQAKNFGIPMKSEYFNLPQGK